MKVRFPLIALSILIVLSMVLTACAPAAEAANDQPAAE